MRAGWYRFWSPQTWRDWSGARRVWSDHQRARSSLAARIAAADAEIRSASEQFIRADRNHRWASELNPVELPIRMKRGEIGLGRVQSVELLETRRRDGADVWTVVDRGAVLFTNQRMVFDGAKEVSFVFADITADSVGPDGWTVAVSSRKRSHTLAGPIEQLMVCRQAVADGTGGTDPRFRWRVLMDESTERRRRAEGAHRESVAELDGLSRPDRPVSPAWVPAGVAVALALALPGPAVAPPDTTVVEALVTTTTGATPEPTVLGVTVTSEASEGMVARVVEVLSADTVSVRLASGERVSVRLAGVEGVDSVGPAARQMLAQLIGGQDVELVTDAAAGAHHYYLYLDGSLVNTELVSRGLARSSGAGLALADLFVTAAASAEQQAVGIWAPTPHHHVVVDLEHLHHHYDDRAHHDHHHRAGDDHNGVGLSSLVRGCVCPGECGGCRLRRWKRQRSVLRRSCHCGGTGRLRPRPGRRRHRLRVAARLCAPAGGIRPPVHTTRHRRRPPRTSSVIVKTMARAVSTTMSTIVSTARIAPRTIGSVTAVAVTIMTAVAQCSARLANENPEVVVTNSTATASAALAARNSQRPTPPSVAIQATCRINSPVVSGATRSFSMRA